MATVKRLARVSGNILLNNTLLRPGQLLDNISGRINKTTDAGICTPCHPFPVFDGAQPRVLHMLFVALGISPPTVIGDHADQVCSPSDKPCQVVAVNAFITNGRSYLETPVETGEGQGGSVRGIPARSATEFIEQRGHKTQERGQDLYSRNEL